jgi:hypothetical protein
LVPNRKISSLILAEWDQTTESTDPRFGDLTAAPSAAVSDLAPTRTLRAAIKLGDPVLASGTPEDPCGVTVDLAREVARRLGVPATFVCFDAARETCEAVTSEAADVCFVAIEPTRETELAFTPPYAVIEDVYVVPVPDDSPVIDPSGVDCPGTRVGVKRGSAYDLFLTRTRSMPRWSAATRGSTSSWPRHSRRGRDPAACHGMGGTASGAPRRRAGVHPDPARRGDHADPPRRKPPPPAGVHRGREGDRLRLGGAKALRR